MGTERYQALSEGDRKNLRAYNIVQDTWAALVATLGGTHPVTKAVDEQTFRLWSTCWAAHGTATGNLVDEAREWMERPPHPALDPEPF